ncbi:MAG: GTP cyclohydrolase II [Myxococcota bacterium]|nr:GTP cyclohydrolase II [Myxococcota bacterium]
MSSTSLKFIDDKKLQVAEEPKRMYVGQEWVEIYAEAELPTRYGNFRIFVFRNSIDAKEHVALVRGNPLETQNMPVRIHSECLTGDVFASLRCDCRQQLEMAMTDLGSHNNGMLIYMRQEGRGIGLGNKIRAYSLQQFEGMDTVEANLHLGFDDDLRDYRVTAMILKMLGAQTIQLITNNPRKINGLRENGIGIAERQASLVQPNQHNAEYLATKAQKSGHIIPHIHELSPKRTPKK